MTTDPVRPSDGELAILRVLWDRGPSTVRDVHADLAKGRDIGYTTVLKLLQIMVDKGLVTRDESARSHVYQAAQGEAPTQACLLRELMDKAFEGSAKSLVLRALTEAPTGAAELEEIQAFLDRLRKGRP
ncbi:transcriptional regulator [Geothrix rubra]|uniref:Transcriptional regulator n=1 Tax=Geothrix rubra TaxID=2927977 RepID=A0ABQ5Q525_9BACT|nr:BlaI/MecI/CopY family transcriptional regulator [Geothrix rubra]GLH69215.1 transcriptional regulator [Geothrix rubra]